MQSILHEVQTYSKISLARFFSSSLPPSNQIPENQNHISAISSFSPIFYFSVTLFTFFSFITHYVSPRMFSQSWEIIWIWLFFSNIFALLFSHPFIILIDEEIFL